MTTPQESTKLLVLVDDDSVEERILRAYLDEAGVSVDLLVFQSGACFLDYMDDVKVGDVRAPHVVLLDVRMPEMNGFQVLARLHEDSEPAATPRIIMFSNSKDERDAASAQEFGAAYQIKPAGGDEYIAFLKSLDLRAA
jgi:DNA-binding response OmpR family regulator